MQGAHQLGHLRVVVWSELEVGARRLRAVNKQRQRRVHGVVGQAGTGLGQRQCRQHLLGLTVLAQHPARCDQQVQVWQFRQPARQVLATHFDQLLKVVQHQQHAPAHQAAHHLQRGGAGVGCPALLQRVQDRVQHLMAVAARSQGHKGHQVKGHRGGQRLDHPAHLALRSFSQCTRDFNRQPGLARAPWPAQHHQPLLGHRSGQRRAGPFKSDQAGQVARQPSFEQRGRGWRSTSRGLGRRLAQGQSFGTRGQVGALLQHPFVKVARQQFALVQPQAFAAAALVQRLFKSGHVASHGMCGQPYGTAVGVQHRRRGRAC